MTDLDTAIQRYHEALHATTPADHPDRARRLDNLGIGYHDRYQRTGTMADLDTAIQRSQEAVDATPADHPDRARRLDNLGIGYHDRYQRTGTIADLDTAIQRSQEAVDATPADHLDRVRRLDRLGDRYQDRDKRALEKAHASCPSRRSSVLNSKSTQSTFSVWMICWFRIEGFLGSLNSRVEICY